MKGPDWKPLRRMLVPLLGLTLVAAACNDGTEGPEAGADVEDVTEPREPFDEDEFFNDPSPFLGEEVTVSAEVNLVLSPTTFVIAGVTVPDLLVIGAQSPGTLSEDSVVRGTWIAGRDRLIWLNEAFGDRAFR